MARWGKTLLQRQSTRFSLLLVVFALGTFLSMHQFERILLNQVQAVTEAANVAFTRLFVNEAWVELRPLLELQGNAHPRDNPSLRNADMRARQFAKGTDLIKVKIYNMQGLTIYSSDPAQLGEQRSSNKGFQEAARGGVASETNYRGKFGAFDGELYQRNLVSSYVPVKGDGGVEAVVEVYADRTASIEGVESEVRKAWTYFGPSMVVAFLLVWLVSQSGGRSQENTVTQVAGEGEPASTAALLEKAVQVLRGEREQLDQLLEDHVHTPPDLAAWQAMRASLQSFSTRIDELSLAQDPDNATSLLSGGKQMPLEKHVESVMAVFKDRYTGQGIELSGHIAPTLAGQNPTSPRALSRLLDLLLEEALRRTGRGLLRLNLQPGSAGAMQIEVVSTRADDGSLPDTTKFDQSLTLAAASCVAIALKGQIEKISTTSRGSWLSASVPINT